MRPVDDPLLTRFRAALDAILRIETMTDRDLDRFVNLVLAVVHGPLFAVLHLSPLHL